MVANSNKRDYKFDLLRIIAMLMIIMHHCVINDFGLQNALNTQSSSLSNNQIIILIIVNSLVIIGVNIFFLISGYFRIKFTFKKIINLLLQIYIVYDLVTLIGIWTGHINYNKDVLMALLNPIQQYWYLSAYIGLMVFAPLLNKILEQITKKEANVFVIMSVIVFSLFAFRFDNGLVINGGYSLIWGIILYLIGGFIYKFNIINRRMGILLFFMCAIINGIIVWYIYNNNPVIEITAWNLYKYNNILVFTQSIGLFIFIKSLNLSIKNKNIIYCIGFFAPNTLMTYLLHSTCWLTFFRAWPINKIISIGQFKVGIILLPLYSLFIFLLCSLISIIYKNTIQKMINHINK